MPPAHGAPARPILVVEDQADVREAIVVLLRTYGYRTLEADNGQVALDVLQRSTERPCLIILDLAMPVMDGDTFRKRLLRDHHEWAQIPVVVSSAFTRDAARLQQLAVADYMTKPLDPDRLIALVERHCESGAA